MCLTLGLEDSQLSAMSTAIPSNSFLAVDNINTLLDLLFKHFVDALRETDMLFWQQQHPLPHSLPQVRLRAGERVEAP